MDSNEITLDDLRSIINSGYLKNNDFKGIVEQIKELDVNNHIKRICPICGSKHLFFIPFNNRKHAKCPNCGSLERHRFLYFYLKEHTMFFTKKIKLLHFAPEKMLFYKFDESSNIDYITADLMLQKFVKVQMDMCNIPCEDDSFDIIIANHILEHIPDDITAMEELYRVVKPYDDENHNKVFIMIPLFRNLKKTFENPEYNTPELRLKYFGQKDHVRKYGLDFKNRLQSVGFDVLEIKPESIFSEQEIIQYGLNKDVIFECKKIL